ncbi:prepilin-type N-terminal cleavage/methylation domain-containing protein [Pseudoalteromonas sp. MEBiC 03607]|jgi:prepilin-type N-terminal cleavage/methylation domain-containing protein|uniref:prepilin-type N-terminal cleavage/methylation domain-containing protein n=1 Tax=unclassified Pseudoalteromonas TaxID=194690 RepID=UPI000C59D667|nr:MULTISPECIES: prepilin-type N-terminal cleavage/methylation domain-containing protein [unclassified Pseudoalteromonas]MBU77779.1 prepilin-type cleavage/methylation domain-containing protein [Pseudoalteromonadaceae bacterium]MCF2899691.1 prepilin-type N-terminal cleavage/methylation domain-containing protein [Pseudoalteromonas sp. OFAV1]MCO7248876.1 prepilin-type N-terminal cleavage/methylation domain-containing protein [Pseudoalteromonas sp. Ps84H-4]TGV21643.1 prepilin-type N-terminal cleava|tara:strand:+ start:1967 stop:2491 length:525 start_codon:yes stop_codon:yes gene_type:complete
MMKRGKGFSLVELMVALAAGAFLLAGVSLSYSAIKSTIAVSKELENAQEVIRFTSKVFTRSIKQTQLTPIVSADNSTITITQPSGVIACDGSITTSQVTEIYRLNGNDLLCSLNGAVAERLLTGIEALSFSLSGDLVTISVKPRDLPTQFGQGINIDIALTNAILLKAYGNSRV